MPNRSAEVPTPLTPMHSDSSGGSSSPPSKNRAVNVRDSLRYFIAGNIAGMTGVVVGQPFDTLKVRMQTQELVALAQAQSGNHSANAIAHRVMQPPAVIVDAPHFTQQSSGGAIPRSRLSLTGSAASGAARNFAAPSYFQPPVFSIGGGLGSMRGRGTLSAQSFSSAFVSGSRTTTVPAFNVRGPMGLGSVAATAVAAVAAAPSSIAASAGAATAGAGGAMPLAAPLFTSPFACFLATLRGSGVRGLYRGMSSPLLLVGVQKSVAFGVFGTVCQHLQGSKHLPSLFETCVAGVAGGVANSLILTPIDQMKIAMQIQSYGNPGAVGAAASGELHLGSAKQPSMLATAGTILREQGLFRGVYGNFRATLLREIPMYSIYYTLYGYLSRTFLVDPLNRSRFQPPQQTQAQTAGAAVAHATEAAALLNASPLSAASGSSRFWPPSSPNQELLTKLLMGGLTGVGCWASCYPLDAIKTHMVAQTAQNIPEQHRRNIREMAAHIYRTGGGIRPFYNGLTPALLRAFPVHAVVFFTFAYVSEMLEKHDAF